MLTPEQPVHRIHRQAHGPWWFNRSGDYRFDITDPRLADLGTCYFAEDPLGAFVEVFSGFRLLPQVELRSRRLFTVSIPAALSLADLCSDSISNFDLDASIASSSEGDYSASQEFAVECARAGFGGVRYHVRHSISNRLVGIALFGPVAELVNPPAGTRNAIPDDVVVAAARRYGFRLAGPFLDP